MAIPTGQRPRAYEPTSLWLVLDSVPSHEQDIDRLKAEVRDAVWEVIARRYENASPKPSKSNILVGSSETKKLRIFEKLV